MLDRSTRGVKLKAGGLRYACGATPGARARGDVPEARARSLWRAPKGAVTRTEFCHLNIGEPDSDSGRGGGSPRPEGFLAEDAERAAGCEMALDVESVLDGGVNG
jgi:hypothetical protein